MIELTKESRENIIKALKGERIDCTQYDDISDFTLVSLYYALFIDNND